MANSKNNNDGCKVGIQEQGGVCSDPNLHQEPQENTCRAMLYKDIDESKIYAQQLNYRLYLAYGKKCEIDKQILKVRNFEGSHVQEKSCSHGTKVSFQNSTPDNDNFTIQMPICGEEYKVSVTCDETKCLCISDPKVTLISMKEIQNKSRKCLEETHEMRLHNSALPFCFTFSLLCKKKCQLRTPINFYIVVTPVDKNGKDIPDHTHEIQYPACFYDAEAANNQNLGSETAISVSSNERQIIDGNFEEIKDMLQDEKVETVLRWLVSHGVLKDKFLKTILSSMDKRGELLRHLLQLNNILPPFIEALKAAGNKELVDFLHERIDSTKDHS